MPAHDATEYFGINDAIERLSATPVAPPGSEVVWVAPPTPTPGAVAAVIPVAVAAVIPVAVAVVVPPMAVAVVLPPPEPPVAVAVVLPPPVHATKRARTEPETDDESDSSDDKTVGGALCRMFTRKK